jgi:hypothetical protein
MPPLAKAAAEMRDQHLADGGFIADQLHQLIDAILLQQIFGTLLLQGEAGIEKGQPRTLAAASASQVSQPRDSIILSRVRIWRREQLSISASSLSVVSCDLPSQHCHRRMNCCCRRPEDIKGELLRKTQQFITPYIKPIMNPDEARR